MEAGADLRLLMLHTDDDVYLFPTFQLLDGKAVAGLQEVLLVLQVGVSDPWTWAQWLNVALPQEDPPRNITLLYEGASMMCSATRGTTHGHGSHDRPIRCRSRAYGRSGFDGLPLKHGREHYGRVVTCDFSCERRCSAQGAGRSTRRSVAYSRILFAGARGLW